MRDGRHRRSPAATLSACANSHQREQNWESGLTRKESGPSRGHIPIAPIMRCLTVTAAQRVLLPLPMLLSGTTWNAVPHECASCDKTQQILRGAAERPLDE
jgi:hypothetical protein